MTNKTGKVVTDSLRIRSQPSTTTGTVIGALILNDVVTGDIVDNWWNLVSWTRNGQPISLPKPGSSYSLGIDSTRTYIQEVQVTPPPPPPQIEEFVVEVTHEENIGGVIYVPEQGNPIRFVKKA